MTAIESSWVKIDKFQSSMGYVKWHGSSKNLKSKVKFLLKNMCFSPLRKTYTFY